MFPDFPNRGAKYTSYPVHVRYALPNSTTFPISPACYGSAITKSSSVAVRGIVFRLCFLVGDVLVSLLGEQLGGGLGVEEELADLLEVAEDDLLAPVGLGEDRSGRQ